MIELAVLVFALATLTAGCSMAWLPLGPIVLGALLLAGIIVTRLRTPIVVRTFAPPNTETDE